MVYNIDAYDKNLLYELDKDASISLTKLAKKLRRSKAFVLYRMKKLENEKIITGYHAIVDMSAAGYFTFRVYIKFQQTTKEEQEKFVQFARKISNIWTVTSMHGKWDCALFLGVKSIEEFHSLWNAILNGYKEKIKSHNMAIYAPIHNFNRTFLFENRREKIERIYGCKKEKSIEDKDLNFIKVFSENVRIPYLEIARKTRLSPETVKKKIRKLEKDKVIVGYKIGFDVAKLGYISYRVDIQLRSTLKNNALFMFCRNHNSVYQINKTLGGADFEIEVIVENFHELSYLIDEIKSEFSDVINDVEYFEFSTYHVLKYIPD